MAEIVFGLGVPHSPMLSTPVDEWPTYIEKDRNLPDFLGGALLGTDGEFYSFDELEKRAPSGVEEHLSMEQFAQKHQAGQEAIAESTKRLKDANVDVLVAIGDDHQEVFKPRAQPALAVYCSDTMMNVPPNIEDVPPIIRHGLWGWYEDKPTEYPAHGELGNHLASSLVANGFDVASVQLDDKSQSMSHAYTFFHRRIMNGDFIPMVPVWLNTFYPPNQPTMKRCYDFGKAIARAISDWDSDARVGVVASGGLSHFVVDEELDQTVIKGLREQDFDSLFAIPEKKLRSGNSEIRNWVTLGAATEHLDMDTFEYLACYRSTAGTGCGIAFASWQ